MARDRAQTTRGYVLHIAGYGEADKLVTLYSNDLGRFTAIAKGALKSKQRFVNKLEPYSLLSLFYLPPRTSSGLYFLEEAELLAANLPPAPQPSALYRRQPLHRTDPPFYP